MFKDFFYDCFHINLKDYENIGFDLEICKVILVGFIALSVGIVILNVYRKNIRFMVMQLIRHGAVDSDTSKTLEDIGLHNNRILKWLLTRDGMLKKVVGRVGEPTYTYEEYIALDNKTKKENEKVDFSSASFYIREDKRERADEICERYDAGIVKIILSCVFIAITYVCLLALMPQILSWVNSLIGKLKM